LDYFSTTNPFLEELKTHSSIPAPLAETVVAFCTEFARHLKTEVGHNWDQHTWEERLRRSMLEQFINQKIYTWDPVAMMQHATVQLLVPAMHAERTFLAFVAVLVELEHKKETTTVADKTTTGKGDTPASPIDVVLDYCMMSELPSHPSTRQEMVMELKVLDNTLSLWKQQNIRPSVVTIACSAEDGFIPQEDVKWLLNELLHVLNRNLEGTLDVIPEHTVEELYGIATGKFGGAVVVEGAT
jgi:hypothetical protein